MASKRCVVFTGKDGSKWAVAAEVIAHNRAAYYAEDDPDTTYEAEFEYTLKDDYELADWLGNNMNAEDVEAYAVRIRPPQALTFRAIFDDQDDTDRDCDVKPDPSWNLPLPPEAAK
jgi:hypothetical protein